MDNIYEIFKYLPYRYKIKAEEEYFKLLRIATEVTYREECFNISTVSLHMIYMAITYHYLSTISNYYKSDFGKLWNDFSKANRNLPESLAGEPILDLLGDPILDLLGNPILDLSKEVHWANFSLISEKSVFEFYALANIPQDKIDFLKKPVEERNNRAHSNGVRATKDTFKNYSDICLENLLTINNYCKKIYEEIFNIFTEAHEKLEEDDYDDENFLERNFVAKYCVNINMIDLLSKVQVTKKNKSYINYFKEVVATY